MLQYICRQGGIFMPKSLIEYAFECVSSSKDPIPFANIWNYAKEQAGLSEEEAQNKVARFYTNLLLDGRFVMLGDNVWDLRVRHTFDKVHIDMKDVYTDVEASDDIDLEEEEEEKEYNEAFEEKNNNDEEGGFQDSDEDSEN